MNVEYSLGPFSNWFLPTCLDIWSSGDANRVLCSYGARNMLCLLTITKTRSMKAYDCVNVFSNSKSIISCTQFARKGSNATKRPLLFIGSNDGEAAVMDCNSNEIVYQKVVFKDLDLPSKKILSADWSDINDNPIVYYSMHSVIICWNLKTKVINKLMVGENYRNKIAISCIAANKCGAEKVAIGYMNGDITIIYLENTALNVEQTLSGHCDDICSLSFSWTKGQYLEGVLASVSRDGFVKVWDVGRKYNIADIKLDANKSKNKNWFSLAVMPNTCSNDKFEILIGPGSGDLLVIEIPSKPPDSKIRIHKPMSFCKHKALSHSSVVFSIAIDLRTMFAITSSLDHQILVWDLIERKAISSFNTFSHGLNDISVSPIDPLRLAIAIGDGFHIIHFDHQLNVKNQRRFPVPFRSKDSKGLAIVWHPECENRLAFGTSGGEIVVFDLNSSQKSSKYSSTNSLHDSTKIYGLVWGPSLEDSEESTLYCVHQSGRLYLHYISSNKVLEFTHYVNEDKKRTEIVWKSNYKHLAVGNENGSVDVFEHQRHELQLKLRINVFRKAILCLRWNSTKDDETSNWLAVSSYSNDIHCYSLHNYLNCSNCSNGSIEGTDSAPVVAKANRVLKGHSDRISSMSWCPHDSNKLVSVSYDKTAQVWDVPKETPLVSFGGHRGLLYSVLWSPFDEDLIFSGGEDNYFHAWRPSKQSLKTLNTFNERNYIKTNDYWPHLESQPLLQTEDQNSVLKVLNDCIDRVVLNENCALNASLNGCLVEDKQRQQKPKNKIKNKSNKEPKRISIFPLSNSIEKSSTKYQKIEDIEALFERMNGTVISGERTDRILLYGNSDDIKKFIEKEVSHHLKQGNKEQKEIVGLLYDIKTTIEELVQQKDTNPHLVALSMSVSRNLWKESMNLLAQQLLESDAELNTYRLYRIELSAIVMISQNRVKEAIDLLLSNQLFREAVIVAKVKLFSEQTIEYLMTEWAKHRQNNHDFEGAAKCLTAVRKFNEAADVLEDRNDQQFGHTICLLRSST